jgi:hypothetical protein
LKAFWGYVRSSELIDSTLRQTHQKRSKSRTEVRGGYAATRVIKLADSALDTVAAGFQFNFTVRRQVAREDGDEHLFDCYTVVVRSDENVDEDLAVLAANEYSIEFKEVQGSRNTHGACKCSVQEQKEDGKEARHSRNRSSCFQCCHCPRFLLPIPAFEQT